MSKILLKILGLIFILIQGYQLSAHDIRPAFLELNQGDNNKKLTVHWKISLFGNPEVELMPVLSNFDLDPSKALIEFDNNSKNWYWEISLEDQFLEGQVLTIQGLEMTMTDVMVKWIKESEEEVYLLKPDSKSMVLGKQQGTLAAISQYTKSGIEHIMIGIDHLLFVLGLLLLSTTRWSLFKTITSFTVGHSISLALTTFGFIFIAEKPLSALIALSIVFLGWELCRKQQGKSSLTIRNPWIVSFFFGIIHGIGFAGGLVELGLPDSDIPLALLFFNIGVEIGQLAFIAIALAVMASIKKLEFRFPRWTNPIPAHILGSLATFWFIQRFVDMF